MGTFSLYLHLPFCQKKCAYCNFISFAGKEDQIDCYVESLKSETQSMLEIFRHPISSIFFGGGTPTLLKPIHFENILDAIGITLCPQTANPNKKRGHKFADAIEITVEANPGTVTQTSLRALRKLGINRLSLGAQTFNNSQLKIIGRIHSAKQIFSAMKDARTAGFDNINLDLIFALPNQTLDEWKADLEQAIKLQPEHLSIYNLQIEEGTPLWFQTKSTRGTERNRQMKICTESELFPSLHLPTNETEAKMYAYAIKTLKAAGFNHYEISNFAKPGFECKHNINYWRNGNYLGVGAAAASHVSGNRFENPNTIEEYISQNRTSRIPKWLQNKISVLTKPNYPDPSEIIFMGLRLTDGICQSCLAGFEKETTALITKNLLTKTCHGNIKLSPKGLFFANEVFREFV